VLGRTPGEALWPARWPIESLEAIAQSLDRTWWQALYQQRPGRGRGACWPAEYFGEFLFERAWPERFEYQALSIDPSLGRRRGDYSAIVLAGVAGALFWVDASLERRPGEQAVSDALDFWLRYRPDVMALEANAFQELLAAEFDRQCAEKRLPPVAVRLVNQQTPKETRIRRLGAYLARRKLAFRDTPGCRLLVRQLREFPLSEHDDGPDALELAIRTLCDLAASTAPGGMSFDIAMP
jgi:predicted phage terminase large subunit-like protein